MNLFPRDDICMTDVAIATHAGLVVLLVEAATTRSERAAQSYEPTAVHPSSSAFYITARLRVK